MEQDIYCFERERMHLMQDRIGPDALGELLRDRGLTHDAAAVLGQVETSTISRWVRGQSKPRPQTIVTLARALGISAKRLEAMTKVAWDAAHSAEEVSA